MMINFNKIKQAISTLVLVCPLFLWGWYPEYTVLSGEFTPSVDYLRPGRFTSLELEGLGIHMARFNVSPIENVFQNPAKLGTLDANVFSLIVDTNRQKKHNNGNSMHHYEGVSSYDAYFIPTYQEQEKKRSNPLVQAVFLGKIAGGLSLGGSLEYFFDRNPFYQPTWYWGPMRYTDAMGSGMVNEARDPYGDYSVVSDASNLETESGLNGNVFASIELGSSFVFGVKAGSKLRRSVGEYSDLNKEDDAYWAPEYEQYYTTWKNGEKTWSDKEIGLGIIWKINNNSEIGVAGGYLTGTTGRQYEEMDSSRYFSRYPNDDLPENDNVYTSTSFYNSQKNWDYDGNGYYGEVSGTFRMFSEMDLAISAYFENSLADLKVSETMDQRSAYNSDWYSLYDSTWQRYHSLSNSNLNREGEGKLEKSSIELSIGANWQLEPNIKVIGGIFYGQENSTVSALEPFSGSKFSEYTSSGSYNSESINIVDEIKSFDWTQKINKTVLSLPIGVILKMGEMVQFSLGASKIIEAYDEYENYDVIYDKKYAYSKVDGTESELDKTQFVEAYRLSGTHRFNDVVNLNLGATLFLKDYLKLSAALVSSELEPERVRFGLSIVW